MKTNRNLALLTAATGVSLMTAGPLVAAPDHGETMTKAVCMACHGETQAGQQRQAPPMAMVKRRYQSAEKWQWSGTS